ncbi:MAG TPA: hypothetical protein VFF06_10535 [Polyangia bacterium]|nr:hypothetical protein [Polyangia bacterium]
MNSISPFRKKVKLISLLALLVAGCDSRPENVVPDLRTPLDLGSPDLSRVACVTDFPSGTSECTTACGGPGQPCCDVEPHCDRGTCADSLLLHGSCVLDLAGGGPGMRPADGGACDPGLRDFDGACIECGHTAEPCCRGLGDDCAAPLTCRSLCGECSTDSCF